MGYAVALAFCVLFIVINVINIINAIRSKKYLDILETVLLLPFVVFMSSGFVFGGSAEPNADVLYDLYEEGHYYLSNHGKYVDVSYEIYTYMRIVEIIGIAFFILGFAFILIRRALEKRKEKIKLLSGSEIKEKNND